MQAKVSKDETEKLIVVLKSTYHTEEAMSLVRLGANPDAKDQQGYSLLHRFVLRNDVNGSYDTAIKELVSCYHANIDIQNSSGLTPLQWLITDTFYAEAAMKLVRLGANPDTKDQQGYSLLHRFVIGNDVNGSCDAAIKELVSCYHANIDIQNSSGLTPLQWLITDTFYAEAAMKLVRLGANPDTKDQQGYSLLHRFVIGNDVNGSYDAAIKELVSCYHANIDIQNSSGLTPLQWLITDTFYAEAAMKLVRLGANPDTKDRQGYSLLERFTLGNINNVNDAAINELNNFRFEKENLHSARNDFLNFLILLAKDRSNKASTSCFKFMPVDIIAYIVTFLDFEKMKRTRQECISLTKFLLTKPEEILNRIAQHSPGGINIFQQNDKNKNPTFTFFKSVHTFCNDYEKLKNQLKNTQERKNPVWDSLTGKEFTDSSMKKLDKFSKMHALNCWIEHSSLYSKPENKKKLLESIKNAEAYNNPHLKSLLKIH